MFNGGIINCRTMNIGMSVFVVKEIPKYYYAVFKNVSIVISLHTNIFYIFYKPFQAFCKRVIKDKSLYSIKPMALL